MDEDIDRFVKEVEQELNLVYQSDAPSEHPMRVKNIVRALHFLLSRAGDKQQDCHDLATEIANKIASMP